MSAADDIKRIEKKVDIVLSENQSLKGKLSLGNQKIEELTLELNYARERIKSLENQIKINNIAKGNLEKGSEVREMKERLNEVIREVDRCIRYLKG